VQSSEERLGKDQSTCSIAQQCARCTAGLIK
jgi:hypothetical protein